MDPGLDDVVMARHHEGMFLPFAGAIRQVGDIQAYMVWLKLFYLYVTSKVDE